MAWAACMEEDARTCRATLAAVPIKYRLEGTGFTKVTIAKDNPAPASAYELQQRRPNLHRLL
eukprot:505090-Pleurochrysis_carterae.AAC.1